MIKVEICSGKLHYCGLMDRIYVFLKLRNNVIELTMHHISPLVLKVLSNISIKLDYDENIHSAVVNELLKYGQTLYVGGYNPLDINMIYNTIPSKNEFSDINIIEKLTDDNIHTIS